ncbi:MAG: HAMP domain-containing histidine kinase [Phycisphaerae bacterium]|nr:HAMP domain-containing histidine kinase [Phycisphaerae bacterium]MCZ2401534.1 HAMP domain-containing histidine kinase [Phycisphaerae bacterium]
MTSTRNIWLAFAASALLVFAAMGWLTASALRLERAEAAARQQAQLEESVRLALWRMESFVAPLISREAARPYFHYSSLYSIERAYSHMWEDADYGDLLVPSPLMQPLGPEVLLHFQLDGEGRLTSPLVPPPPLRKLAENAGLDPQRVETARQRLAALDQRLDRAELLARLPAPASAAPPAVVRLDLPAPPPQLAQRGQSAQTFDYQQQRGQTELEARQRAFGNLLNQPLEGAPADAPRGDLHEGALAALWAGEALLLARRVRIEGRELVQGCWLNWDALRELLTREVADLLPAARLEPVPDEPVNAATRRLATLPVRLDAGPLAPADVEPASPVRLALLAAWTCLALAVGSVALLLHGALLLSERRAAFVSAVTHELRTPLTTFRLYADLLAREAGGAEQRRGYVETLQREALRLSHLVENVLVYARLERGRQPAHAETLTLCELVERLRPRLADRAAQAGLALAPHVCEADAQRAIAVDAAAVEQIVFNLVDNACKYAGPSATERTIRLTAQAGRSETVELRVQDHGPGIGDAERARLFRPFHKSAREAAHSAPGVGLGLALSRRLARALGGDLLLEAQLDAHVGAARGACFVLRLPARAPSAAGPAC